MPYKIKITEKFEKRYRNFNKNEKKQIDKTIKLLVQNPLHPSLRTKKIKGTENIFECSANMDIRIIWYYEGENLIILLDVGHHDILKRF